MRFLISFRAIVLIVPLAFFAGCQNLTQTDLVSSGRVTAKAGDSPVVDLSQPKVMQNGDAVDMSGVVTRKPGMDGKIDNGYVLIQLADAAGNPIDEIWSTWTPVDIPTDGARAARWEVHYLWTAPSGATVTVLYGPTAEGINAGGANGKGGGKPAGPSHAPPKSSGHNSNWGGTFSSGMGFRH